MSGMDNIQDQIRALEASVTSQQTSIRRQRFAIVALGTILAGSALIGAVRPAGDATFDTITCKGWRVLDSDGKVRISATTAADGTAGVAWADKDEKVRILASTLSDGTVTYPTKDGK